MRSSKSSELDRLRLSALRPLTYLLPKKFGRPLRRSIRDRLALPDADAVLVSFPKSGRTWVRVMMSRVCHTHFGVPGEEIFEFDNLHRLNARVPRILFTHDGEPWHSPAGLKADKAAYAGKKVILLARHPIDTVVSRYFHIRNRATWIPYPEYKDLPLGEFVWAPLGGLPTIVAYMNIWDRARSIIPDLLMVRYEDFRSVPGATLSRVFDFLGIDATEEEIAEAVSYASFENLRKKEEGRAIPNHRLGARQEGNPDSLKVRRGKVRGYLDYFSEAEVARMEAFVRDELAPSYGYGKVMTDPTAGQTTSTAGGS